MNYSSDDECIEYDTCVRCFAYVLVKWTTGIGYSIADCDYTGDMCCRECLDKSFDEQEAALVIQRTIQRWFCSLEELPMACPCAVSV